DVKTGLMKVKGADGREKTVRLKPAATEAPRKPMGDMSLSAARAPQGYTAQKPLVIQGHPYVGGEFIPGDVLAKAPPRERAAAGVAPAAQQPRQASPQPAAKAATAGQAPAKAATPAKEQGAAPQGQAAAPAAQRANPAPPPRQAQAPAKPQAAQPMAQHQAAQQAAHADYQANGTKAKAFKAWFGDWEGDTANSSKVVGADGKPQPNEPIAGTSASKVTDATGRA